MARMNPDSPVAHRYFGDLYTTPYTSANGNRYPGRYYSRIASRPVSKVIVHHMANGASNITCETLLKVAKKRTGSWTYTVMTDGEIVQWLPESVAPWTTSSYDADIDAITIEVENCKGAPSWEISAKAYRSLVRLLSDICNRNPGLSNGLRFDGTKKGSNIHFHEWYANTNCPGQYIKGLVQSGSLIDDVNDALAETRMQGKVVEVNMPVYTEETVSPEHGEHRDENGMYFIEKNGNRAVSKWAYVRDQDAWKYYGDNGYALVNRFAVLPDGEGLKVCLFDTSGKAMKGLHDVVRMMDFDEDTAALKGVYFAGGTGQ